MKKLLFLVIIAVFILAMTSAAFAGLGEHKGIFPGYPTNPDECAGCHRAHTATSPITLALDPSKSALLTSGTTTDAFCQTCHGSDVTGAYTNVYDGIFDLTTSTAVDRGGLSGTNSVDQATLNGGGFNNIAGVGITSDHNVSEAATATTWGEGTGGPGAQLLLKCTNCHDAHGNDNYRSVLPDPDGKTTETAGPVGNLTVRSTEDIYSEDTTQTISDVDFTQDGSGNPYLYESGMSEWCTDCHEQYMTTASTYDFDSSGSQMTYRHNMDVDINTYKYDGYASASTTLPLESADEGRSNNLNCVTCHRAHGTTASMTTEATVGPAADSALLRLSNRGVCQDCHSK